MCLTVVVFCLQCYMDIYVGPLSHVSLFALLFAFNLMFILPLNVFSYGFKPNPGEILYSCVGYFYILVFAVYYMRTFVRGQHIISPDNYLYAGFKTATYVVLYVAIIAEAFKLDIAVHTNPSGKDNMR